MPEPKKSGRQRVDEKTKNDPQPSKKKQGGRPLPERPQAPRSPPKRRER